MEQALVGNWASHDASDGHTTQDETARTVSDRLTIYGMVLFVIGSVVMFSASSSFRPTIAGLSLHPCQFPLVFLVPLIFLTRLNHFPALPLFMIVVFSGIYCAASLSGSAPFTISEAASPLQETVKLLASVIMTVTVALAIQSRRDYVAAGVGLTLSVGLLAILSLRGFGTEEGGAIKDMLDTGNKNAYSLYALPALLIAGQIILNHPVSAFTKLLLVVAIIASVVGIYASANRSGYVGALLIGILLFWDRKAWGLFVVGGIALAVMYFLVNFVGTETMERRIQQTQEGILSDQLRKDLFIQSLDIAVTHPLLGVSPEFLPFELGRRVDTGLLAVYPHNVIAQVAGGCGLICLAAFLGIGGTLWRWVPRKQGSRPLDPEFREARRILRMMLVLYIFRGQFTHEILYNPGFSMGLGIAIGYCIITADASRRKLEDHETEAEQEEALLV